MTVLRNVLLVLLALLVQTSWMHALSILGVVPDAVLLAIIFIALRRGQVEATAFGFGAGFLLDVYNPEFMGVNSLANALVGFAVGSSRMGIVAEDFRVQGVVFLVGGLLHDLIFFTFSSISAPGTILPLFLRYGIGSAVYTALFGALISLLGSVRLQGGLHLDVRRLHE